MSVDKHSCFLVRNCVIDNDKGEYTAQVQAQSSLCERVLQQKERMHITR